MNQTGRITESVVIIQKALSLATHDAELHNNLGISLHQLNDIRSESSPNEAIRINPRYAEAHFNWEISIRNAQS